MREMYELIQGMSKTLQRIESRLDVLEAKMQLISHSDERSRAALNKAEEALQLSKKLESQQSWLWKSVIGSCLASLIGLLFFFLQKGIGG
jgi:hypothetical protein